MSWLFTSFPSWPGYLSVCVSVCLLVSHLSQSLQGCSLSLISETPLPIYWLFHSQPLKFVWKACNTVHFRWSILMCDQNGIHWRREWQTIPVYLLWELHELYKRPKRWVPQVSSMLLGKIAGELPIAPEWMKPQNEWLDQSRYYAQLWMCLVMKVKSDAATNSIAYEPGMLGPWIKENWMWSSSR